MTSSRQDGGSYDRHSTSSTGEIASFQITTDRSGRKRTFKVIVYDKPSSLQKAARRYSKDGDTYSETLGLVHKRERILVDGEVEYSHNKIGIIRLVKGYLKTGILVHECGHAAMWVFDCDSNEKLPTDNIEVEEMFCHVLGDLTSKLVRKLYAKNLIGA